MKRSIAVVFLAVSLLFVSGSNAQQEPKNPADGKQTTEKKIAEPEKDPGGIHVTYDRWSNELSFIATPNLRLNVGEWVGKVGLNSDGTYARVKAKGVVIDRKEFYFTELKTLVTVNLLEDGRVSIECDMRVRLKMSHKDAPR